MAEVDFIVLDMAYEPRLEKNPDALRSRHNNSEIFLCDQEQDSLYGKIDPSTTPLSDLNLTSINELGLRRVATGKYLALRTLESAKIVNGITTIVEDHDGNVVLFCVYNFTDELNPDLSDILPVGTIFFLKEPCISASEGGDSFLRCDCPSDMILVFKGHPLFQLIDDIEWKHACNVDSTGGFGEPTTDKERTILGNRLFKSGKLHQAIRCYVQAIWSKEESWDEMTKRDEKLLNDVRLKLAEAFFKIGCFEKALGVAKYVHTIDNGNQEARLLTGRCYYQLRKYPLADHHFRKYIGNKAREDRQKVKDRLQELNRGEFDMAEHFLNQDSNPRRLMDCSDYVGPIVRLKKPPKFRGLITTEKVIAGTLLLVSKAYGFSWKPSMKPGSGSSQLFEMGSWQHVLAQLCQLVAKNPDTFSTTIHNMCSGMEEGSCTSDKAYCDQNNMLEPIVNVRKLKLVLEDYALCGSIDDSTKDCEMGGLLKDGLGVLPLASFLNHSCLPNAVAHSLGDVLFVVATKNINIEEEVFVQYVSWEVPYDIRKVFLEWNAFNCRCLICKHDRFESDPASIQFGKGLNSARDTLVASCKTIRKEISMEIFENARFLLPRIRRLCNSFEFFFSIDTYGDKLKNTYLSLPHFLMGRAYTLLNKIGIWNIDDQIKCYERHLTLRNFPPKVMLAAAAEMRHVAIKETPVDETVLESIAGLVRTYTHISDMENRDKWLVILFYLEEIYSGGLGCVKKYGLSALE